MSRTIGWLVAIVLVVTGGWWLYAHSGARSVSGAGDVFNQDGSSATKEQLDIDGNPVKNDAVIAAPAPAPLTPPMTPVAPTQPVATVKAAAGVPATDSIDRQPPSGMAFGGSGKYQWYRQGNLTWRIDTRSGNTCVDFATMDEWSKPIVYTNGCRNRG